MTKDDQKYDQRERRCPKLGSVVSFSYCRTCEPEKAPCVKLLDCWWEYLDIMSYVNAHFSPETVSGLVHWKPKPKVATILELIEKARQNKE
jgi:hypothetical protein